MFSSDFYFGDLTVNFSQFQYFTCRKKNILCTFVHVLCWSNCFIKLSKPFYLHFLRGGGGGGYWYSAFPQFKITLQNCTELNYKSVNFGPWQSLKKPGTRGETTTTTYRLALFVLLLLRNINDLIMENTRCWWVLKKLTDIQRFIITLDAQ